jgi:hypothetical protein
MSSILSGTAILKTPHYQRVTIWGENGWVELVDSSHPDTPGPSTLKITMNDGSTIDKTFEWTDTVSKNIHHGFDNIHHCSFVFLPGPLHRNHWPLPN